MYDPLVRLACVRRMPQLLKLPQARWRQDPPLMVPALQKRALPVELPEPQWMGQQLRRLSERLTLPERLDHHPPQRVVLLPQPLPSVEPLSVRKFRRPLVRCRPHPRRSNAYSVADWARLQL